MKRGITLLIITGSVLLGTFGVSAIATAQEVPPMTDAHIAVIRTNCVEAQKSLNQLHASDALMRVNRGQLYESISTKLMTPLNSRIVLNKMDGLNLVSLTLDFDRQLGSFRENYQVYEEAMSRTLAIDCMKQPVTFYDSVTEAREKRVATHESTIALQQTIKDYEAEFELFAQNTKKKDAQ